MEDYRDKGVVAMENMIFFMAKIMGVVLVLYSVWLGYIYWSTKKKKAERLAAIEKNKKMEKELEMLHEYGINTYVIEKDRDSMSKSDAMDLMHSIADIAPPKSAPTISDVIRVGFVGTSQKLLQWKHNMYCLLIEECLHGLAMHGKSIEVVSGLTAQGLPLAVYEVASGFGYKTVGVACMKALKLKCFDVDEKIISGSTWGDESREFLDTINVLIKIGGGAQSENEFNEFSGPKVRLDTISTNRLKTERRKGVKEE